MTVSVGKELPSLVPCAFKFEMMSVFEVGRKTCRYNQQLFSAYFTLTVEESALVAC